MNDSDFEKRDIINKDGKKQTYLIKTAEIDLSKIIHPSSYGGRKLQIGNRTPIELPFAIAELLAGKTVCDLGCYLGDHIPNYAQCGATKITAVERVDDHKLHLNKRVAYTRKYFPSVEVNVYHGNYWSMIEHSILQPSHFTFSGCLRKDARYQEGIQQALNADVYYAWGFHQKGQSFSQCYVKLKKLIYETYLSNPVNGETREPKILISFHDTLPDALEISNKIIHFESAEYLVELKRGRIFRGGPHYTQHKPPGTWTKDFYLGIHYVGRDI